MSLGHAKRRKTSSDIPPSKEGLQSPCFGFQQRRIFSDHPSLDWEVDFIPGNMPKQIVQAHGMFNGTFSSDLSVRHSVYDNSTQRMESMVFLKPTLCSEPISIQRSFRNVSTTDDLWGYYVVIRMGRLDCPYSEFRLKIAATKSNSVLIIKYILTICRRRKC